MNRRALVVACTLLVSACGSTQAPAPGKYEQTWTTGYGDTTCDQWNSAMTEHQRWVAAADMLVNGRKTWNIDSMPADSLVDTFEADIAENCSLSATSSSDIADVATELLMIGGKDEYGG